METGYVVKGANQHKRNMVEYDGFNRSIILCGIYMGMDHTMYIFLKGTVCIENLTSKVHVKEPNCGLQVCPMNYIYIFSTRSTRD